MLVELRGPARERLRGNGLCQIGKQCCRFIIHIEPCCYEARETEVWEARFACSGSVSTRASRM
jgi:hypothetical protein